MAFIIAAVKGKHMHLGGWGVHGVALEPHK